MKKKTLIVSAMCLMASAAMTSNAMADTKVSGVSIPDQIDLQGSQMVFNGAGVRSKFFMDLYVGSLFTPKVMSDAVEVIAAQEAVAIRLNITSGMITSEKMTEAVYDGFKLAMKGDISPIKESVDTFITAFSEPIQEGDQFTFLSVPSKGIVAFKNGEELSVTQGEDFRRAVLSIWLGDKPTDSDLKEDMLDHS